MRRPDMLPRRVLLALAVVPCMLLPMSSVTAAGVPAMQVDVSSGRHVISRDIYGMNEYEIDARLAKELRVPVQRWGGNLATRYNWLVDSSNSGSDWYFTGGGDNANPVPGAEVDSFVNTTTADGGKSVVTIPIIGYVNKLAAWNCSFPRSRYPNQEAWNPEDPLEGDDCGNGMMPDGKTPIVDTDVTANNLPVDPSFMHAWIQHLLKVHGTAAHGGVGIYELDNEPSDWEETHRDVHPAATGYDELVSTSESYASMIKATDPSAAVLGPSDFGWSAYLSSDKVGDNQDSHDGVYFAEYYLRQMRAYEQQHGVRILDYFDEHYYPNEDNVALARAGNAATQALRLRSTRSLWDPTYVDESWVGKYFPPIQLIPLFKRWVAADYPGTKIAITEYNFGGLESINGALTEADVLGIFGREGLDLATMWAAPTSRQPGAFAFRIYLNYDGHGSAFGNVGVHAASTNQGALAVYAAQRSADKAVTMVIINKTGAGITSTLSLKGFKPTAHARVYRYSAANAGAIVRVPDVPISARGFTATYPANSITQVVASPG